LTHYIKTSRRHSNTKE